MLLQHVSSPARDATHRKDWSEDFCRNSERVHDDGRVEIDIRIQVARFPDCFFNLVRDVVSAGVTLALTYFACYLAQNRRATSAFTASSIRVDDAVAMPLDVTELPRAV